MTSIPISAIDSETINKVSYTLNVFYCYITVKNTVILLKLSVTSAYSMPFNPFELKNKNKKLVCVLKIIGLKYKILNLHFAYACFDMEPNYQYVYISYQEFSDVNWVNKQLLQLYQNAF